MQYVLMNFKAQEDGSGANPDGWAKEQPLKQRGAADANTAGMNEASFDYAQDDNTCDETGYFF